MKAFLLTAGLGTRLRPLTDHTPKCLVPMAGRALIDWWYEAMEAAGVTEVLLNLHHLPEQVREHVSALNTPIRTHFFYEEQLLGSAGTIAANRDFVREGKPFFVLYGDNLTSLPLTDLYRFHLSQPHDLTMALFHTNRPASCGIAELDAGGTVIDFTEKPAFPKSNLANAGLYVFSPAVVEEIPTKQPCDIGFDLLPGFVNRMSGWLTQDYLVDIGTHENLEKARAEWPVIMEKKRVER